MLTIKQFSLDLFYLGIITFFSDNKFQSKFVTLTPVSYAKVIKFL